MRKSTRTPCATRSRQRVPQKRVPGALGCAFGAFWAALGHFLGALGRHRASLGAIWRVPGAPRSLPRASPSAPETTRIARKRPRSIFERFFDVSDRFLVDFCSLFRRFCLAARALAASLRRGCARPTDPLNMFVCGRSARARDDLDDSLFDLSSMRALQVHLVTN